MSPVPLLALAISSFMTAAAATITILAQVDVSQGGNAGLIITGASATATAGALAYVVRMIASGKLVHREPANAEVSLQKALEEAHKREDVYSSFISKSLGTDGS